VGFRNRLNSETGCRFGQKHLNRSWENIKENIKISAKETPGLYGRKQHKQWFDEECSPVLSHRKQAKMQWLQDSNQSNLHNLTNARHEASRHFRNKKRKYLKARINELETNSNNKNIRELYRGITDLRRVTSLELIQLRMRKVIWLQTATVFWLGGGIIFLGY
jgi:hypothetical protein